MLDEIIILLNFACILLLGTLTSYEDMRASRIQNRYILYAVLFGAGTNFLLPLLVNGADYLDSAYLETTLINGILALAAGFLLWYAKIWRAGDGKLFFAFAFLLPVSTYYYGYVQYFPSFTLLVNALIPLFLLLVLNLWIETSNEEKLETVKKMLDPKKLFYMLLSFISVQWAVSLLFSYLSTSIDVLTSGTISILLLTLLSNVFQDILYETSVPITILRILLDYGTLASYNFITQLLLLFALFVVILTFITNLGSFRFNERIRVENLKAGMCCVEKIVMRGEHYVKNPSGGKAELQLDYDDLTEKDIKTLQALKSKGKLNFDEFIIKQTMPFAPFLFLGTIITILLHGDIVSYSKLFIHAFFGL